MTSFYYNCQNASVYCFLFKPQRDRKFKQERKNVLNSGSSSEIIVTVKNGLLIATKSGGVLKHNCLRGRVLFSRTTRCPDKGPYLRRDARSVS